MLAVYDVLLAKLIQHLTAGAKDAQTRAIAASTELTTQGKDHTHFHLEQGHHTDLQGCQILITAKDLKMQFSDPQWPQMWDQFFTAWNGAVDQTFLQEDFYDMAKETITPEQSFPFSEEVAPDQLSLTLTWR
ncbi:hypothetical protein BDW59DRAFT_168019 [Aspergillus cavernicola]|uniref:Uncharacterized protein n=1 Tax=Aspergillus cavernicola TaxID=176166 RepID=A0ABR4H7D7_9EURO